MSATAKTLDLLRKQGFHVWVVEKYAGGIRLDAFGFMDILAYKADSRVIIAVQSTVGGHHAAHIKKYRDNPKVMAKILDWIVHQQFWIISWSKRGERGKRKLWTPRIEVVTADTFIKEENPSDQIRP